MIASFVLALVSAVAAFDEKAVSKDSVEFMRVDRGAEVLPLLIPRDEQLFFRVEIDVGMLGNLNVGDVELRSGAERAPAGLPDARDPDRKVEWREEGWIQSVAKGGYLGYQVEHTLRTAHLPQAWPSVFLRDTQRGSESRRRELKLGLDNGAFTAWYRNDGHCKGCENQEHFIEGSWAWSSPEHCKKCKRAEHRTWREPRTLEVPSDSVDMLSAIYLARSLVRDGRDEADFPLVDKGRLWRVTIRAGKRKLVEVPAGTFDCRKVELSTKLEASARDQETPSSFQGLFGIQGTIGIWMDAGTGVPVLIEGDLPVPIPFVDKLNVRVQLKRYKGTPAVFAPIR